MDRVVTAPQRGLRAKVGWRLRTWADRIDPGHAFLRTGMTITLERDQGWTLRGPVEGRPPGCPIWYYTPDYDLAHDEAERPI